MLFAKIKKITPHRNQAERSAANFEPIFKSLAASAAIMKSMKTGRPAKLVGAQLGAQMGAAHQAEKGAASFEKLSGILDSAHSCLKNKKNGGLS